MCLWEVLVYLTLFISIGISKKKEDNQTLLENGRFRRELTLLECKKLEGEMIFWRKAFICTISPNRAAYLCLQFPDAQVALL